MGFSKSSNVVKWPTKVCGIPHSEVSRITNVHFPHFSPQLHFYILKAVIRVSCMMTAPLFLHIVEYITRILSSRHDASNIVNFVKRPGNRILHSRRYSFTKWRLLHLSHNYTNTTSRVTRDFSWMRPSPQCSPTKVSKKHLSESSMDVCSKGTNVVEQMLHSPECVFSDWAQCISHLGVHNCNRIVWTQCVMTVVWMNEICPHRLPSQWGIYNITFPRLRLKHRERTETNT